MHRDARRRPPVFVLALSLAAFALTAPPACSSADSRASTRRAGPLASTILDAIDPEEDEADAPAADAPARTIDHPGPAVSERAPERAPGEPRDAPGEPRDAPEQAG